MQNKGKKIKNMPRVSDVKYILQKEKNYKARFRALSAEKKHRGCKKERQDKKQEARNWTQLKRQIRKTTLRLSLLKKCLLFGNSTHT